jgi:hypothetical protein
LTFSITSSATCQRGGDDVGEPPSSMLRAAPKKRFGHALNGGAQVFQQAWAAAWEDEAVGRWAMPFREPMAATGRMLQLVALVFPRGQALGRFFAAGREQARPE